MTYAGYLVVGVVADHLGTSRFMASLILGGIFARLPWIREGKLRIIGLLPKRTRLPIMVAILVICLLNFLNRGELVPMLFLGFAATFLLTYPWLRKRILSRAFSSLFKLPIGSDSPKNTEKKVIDVEFREKND